MFCGWWRFPVFAVVRAFVIYTTVLFLVFLFLFYFICCLEMWYVILTHVYMCTQMYKYKTSEFFFNQVNSTTEVFYTICIWRDSSHNFYVQMWAYVIFICKETKWFEASSYCNKQKSMWIEMYGICCICRTDWVVRLILYVKGWLSNLDRNT